MSAFSWSGVSIDIYISFKYPVWWQKLLGSDRSGSTALSYRNWVITLVGGPMRAGYRTCFHTLYDENLNTKTHWKSKMTLWKDKVTLQKVGLTSWKDRNLTNMDSTMTEKCPQGICSGEGEYITPHTCSFGNDLDMYPATTCDCGRKFNSLRGSRFHKARWCKQRNSPAGKCKSNDGPMESGLPPQYSRAYCWESASWRHSLQAKNLVAQG